MYSEKHLKLLKKLPVFARPTNVALAGLLAVQLLCGSPQPCPIERQRSKPIAAHKEPAGPDAGCRRRADQRFRTDRGA